MKQAIQDIQNISPGHIPLVDFHMHTTWTDGQHKSEEMHQAAIDCGLTHILYSEHGRKTSGDWFGTFAKEVRDLPQDKCKTMVGLEAKVLDEEGNIDSTDEILAHCDLVMASVHRFPDEKNGVKEFHETDPLEAVEKEFQLSMAVMENPRVDILGHPFGMSYRRFKQVPPEEKIIELIKQAAKTGVAFEINSHYHPDPWHFINLCQKHNAPVSLGSNAHHVDEVGKIYRALKEGAAHE